MTDEAALAVPRRRALRKAVLASGVLGLCGLGGFGLFVSSLDLRERDPPGTADAIVALTGGAQRVGDAIELLARGYGSRLLITGVNERTSRDEIARLSPRQRSLVQCCVDLDYRARNTIENAAETGRWVRRNGFGSLIVVTSNYHMPRTMAELDRVLPQTTKVPHVVISPALDVAGWWSKPAAARLLIEEYAKYLVVRARNTLPLSPAAENRPIEPRVSRASP